MQRRGRGIDRPQQEIERRGAIVPREDIASRDRYVDDGDRDDYRDDETIYDWSRLANVMRRHRVALACVGLIVVQLIWKAEFLRHYYFRQDDFQVFDTALRSSLSWKFLTYAGAGHLFPGVYFIAWVLSRVALYNWAAASAVVLVMIAAAGVAAWRLFRTLFGNRPAILIPLALYLLAPLTFPTESWWIAAVESLPLQIAIFAALNAHVHYAWTGRFRHAIAAAAWLVFGLIFFEKSMIIPLLLFAVTAGFLIKQRLRSAIWLTAVRLWKAWLLYLALLAGYAAVLVIALQTSKVRPAAPSSAHAVFTFTRELLGKNFLPSALGGPWQWYPGSDSTYAYAAPPTLLAWVAALVAAAIVVGSVLTRRKAWRAWIILAGWIGLADIAPVLISRIRDVGEAGIFGIDTHYLADASAILAIVVGLAFWPTAAPAEAGRGRRRRRVFFTGPWKAIATAVVGVFVVGSVWSVQDFQSVTTSAFTRTYLANARRALAEAPSGTVIFSRLVPNTVMLGIFHGDANTSVVLGPLLNPERQVSWTLNPSGTIDKLMLFGSDGQLFPASIYGSNSPPVLSKHGCTTPKHSTIVIPFLTPTVKWASVLRIGYLASPSAAGQDATVIYAGEVRQLVLKAGLHYAYFAVRGSASEIVVEGPQQFGLCVGGGSAGILVQSPGPPIPSVSS
jgi:hypothetical protein